MSQTQQKAAQSAVAAITARNSKEHHQGTHEIGAYNSMSGHLGQLPGIHEGQTYGTSPLHGMLLGSSYPSHGGRAGAHDGNKASFFASKGGLVILSTARLVVDYSCSALSLLARALSVSLACLLAHALSLSLSLSLGHSRSLSLSRTHSLSPSRSLARSLCTSLRPHLCLCLFLRLYSLC